MAARERAFAAACVVIVSTLSCSEREGPSPLVFAGAPAEQASMPMLTTLTRPSEISERSGGLELVTEDFGNGLRLDDSVDGLIAALADDDIPGNAGRADKLLFVLGARAEPALFDALLSEDEQQRLWAGHLLRRLSAEPTENLLDVSLETLTYEGGGFGGRRLMMIREAAPFLEEHVNAARPRLIQAVQGRDAYRRFFAAVILARVQSSNGIGAVCDVLLGHLENNETGCDATIAGMALQAYGDRALPYVCMAQETESEQAWTILRLIELHQAARTETEEREYLQLRRSWWPGFDPDKTFSWQHDGLLYGASLHAASTSK